MQDDHIIRLLGILYAAPIEPRRWKDFLRELGAVCGADNGAMIAHDLQHHTHRIVAGLGDAIEKGGHRYEAHYWQFDEWTSRTPRFGISGRVGLGEDVWPDSLFLNSVFLQRILEGI